MKTKLLISSILLCLLTGLYFIWGVRYPSGYWNYRMTVSIETPEGVKTGSNIRTMSFHTEPDIFPEQGGTHYYLTRGEAVAIDLGKRGVLFALIRGTCGDVDYGHGIALRVFSSREKTPAGTTIKLSPDQYPLFVRFSDLKDPRTVEEVIADKAAPCPDGARDIETVFGKGVRLKEVSLEKTVDTASSEIENWLPWLLTVRGYISGEQISGQKLYEKLDTADFKRGN